MKFYIQFCSNAKLKKTKHHKTDYKNILFCEKRFSFVKLCKKVFDQIIDNFS